MIIVSDYRLHKINNGICYIVKESIKVYYIGTTICMKEMKIFLVANFEIKQMMLNCGYYIYYSMVLHKSDRHYSPNKIILSNYIKKSRINSLCN